MTPKWLYLIIIYALYCIKVHTISDYQGSADFNKGKCSQSDVPVRISPVL